MAQISNSTYYNTYYNFYNKIKIVMQLQQIRKDPFILQCCLPTKQQPFIGVDGCCEKNAVFCIQHACHINSQGLMHQMMPLREFKRKIDGRKYQMQVKVGELISTFTSFMDRLVEQIRQIKLKKCLQLSMLWLRDLSSSEEEYELMKRIYRMDFNNVTCQDVHSIYFKIIHNQQLYAKQVQEIPCYKGISQVLGQIALNNKAIQLIADKLTQIQGILTNGQILKRALPDRKIINQHIKQVMLQQVNQPNNFDINYNKCQLKLSSPNFKPFFSKYSIVPHTTYHISIRTKYLSVMAGICGQKLKSLQQTQDLHYKQQSILFNCANGNTYADGMFISGSNASIKNMSQISIKLRLTDSQIFIMTNKNLLMRSSLKNVFGSCFLLFQARTEGDSFQVYCDNDISADNVNVLNIIKQQQQTEIKSKQLIEQSHKQQQNVNKNKELQSSENQQLIYSISKQLNQRSKQQISSQALVSDAQNTFGAKSIKKSHNQIFNSQQFELPSKKDLKTNQDLSKIRSSFQQLKKSISNQEDFGARESQKQQRKNQWNSQKDRHLKQIRDRVNAMKMKSKQQYSNRLPQIREYPDKRTEDQLPIDKFRSQSSLSCPQKQMQAQSNHQSKSSKIKINISDADEVSDIASMAKMPNVGGMRRGSDNFNFNFEDISAKVKSLMSQSIQPKVYPQKKQKNKQINTPPKINGAVQKYINQSFQF